jgi:hypothetical protein
MFSVSFDFSANRPDVTAVYALTWHPVGHLLTDRSAFRQLPSTGQINLSLFNKLKGSSKNRFSTCLFSLIARSDGLLTASCNTLRRASAGTYIGFYSAQIPLFLSTKILVKYPEP